MPVPALPPLPPRSATEIVDGAVQLIRPQFGYFLRIAAVGAIPALIQAIITLLLYPTTPTDPSAVLRQQMALLPFTLITVAFSAIQSGAIILGGLALLRGDQLPSVLEAFRAAFRRFFPLMGALILLSLVMAVAFIPIMLVVAFGAGLLSMAGANVIVGVVAATIFFLVLVFLMLSAYARIGLLTAIVLAESLGPVQALSRSQFLSSGSYLRQCVVFGLAGLIMLVPYLVLLYFAFAFQQQAALIQSIFSVLIIPTVPIMGSVMLLSYADLRVRREGADLDAALDALTGAAPLPVS